MNQYGFCNWIKHLCSSLTIIVIVGFLGIPDIPIGLAQQAGNIEEIIISVNGRENFTKNKLADGKEYHLRLSGTFQYSVRVVENNTYVDAVTYADAFYCTDHLGNYTRQVKMIVLNNGQTEFELVHCKVYFDKDAILANGF